jgi:hypothetical protein
LKIIFVNFFTLKKKLNRSQKQEKKKRPDLIESMAARNLLKLSQKEKHKEAAKTLLSLQPNKNNNNKKHTLTCLISRRQSVSKKAAKQEKQKETTQRKRKHQQAAQSLLSLSEVPSQTKPKKWKSELMKKNNK